MYNLKLYNYSVAQTRFFQWARSQFYYYYKKKNNNNLYIMVQNQLQNTIQKNTAYCCYRNDHIEFRSTIISINKKRNKF